MAKERIRLVTEKEYKTMKALVNKYERTWRAKNPKKHQAESKAFVSAIRKAKKA